jgi:hypothetical protein
MTELTVQQRFSNLQAKMAKHGIDKSGKNKQQGYAYRGIDQVMNTVGPMLAEENLVIIPNVLNHNMTAGSTKNGGAMYHHMVEVEYQIIGPDGSFMGPFKSRGECIDTSDKGLNKACTAAYKYWMLTALCIPTESSDADADSPEAGYAVITTEQQNEITRLMMETNTAAPEFLTWLNIRSLPELAAEHFETARNALVQKSAKMANEYAAGETPQ